MNKYIVLLFCVFAVSCDPIENISLQKNKDENKKIVFYGSQYLNPKESKNGKSILALKPNEKETHVIYRIGKWNDIEIEEFTQEIDSVVFIDHDKKLILTDQQKIQSFLKQNRKTIHGNSIVIRDFNLKNLR